MGSLAVNAVSLGFRHPSSRSRDARARAHAYGGIRDVSLAVQPGEVVGLLGPNGGGKSTLLRLLATLLRPHSGTLELLGSAAVPATRRVRRALGYASDTPVHVEALSGRANAHAFARCSGLNRAEAVAAVAALFERFDLERDADKAVREYSHGMRRKLLLTQALAHAPQLMLLDEPTLGLDAEAHNILREMLRARAHAGAASVIATHDLALASVLCDRVLFLVDGAVALAGAPASLLCSLEQATRIRIGLRAPLAASLDLGAAGSARAGDDVLELHAAAGAGELPELCAALLRAQVQVHTIELHEPDLRDVFMRATGRSWGVDP